MSPNKGSVKWGRDMVNSEGIDDAENADSASDDDPETLVAEDDDNRFHTKSSGTVISSSMHEER